MIPITRKDHYLNEIVGWGETAPEKPLTPEEFFFAAILGEAVQTPEPLTRYQMYLAKIAGCNIEIPTPITRLELFLAKACGMDIETPTPITREEIFWSNYSAIVDFEVEGVPPLTYKAVEGTLKNYRIYGNTVNGDSVGDRTGNLFDGIFLQGCWLGSDGSFKASSKWICTQKIPCKANTDYTFTFGIKSRWYGFAWYDIDGNYIESNGSAIERQPNIFTAISPANAAFMAVNIAGDHIGTAPLDIHPSDVTDFMLVAGEYTSETMPNYEPYGCRVPVTVANGTDTQTTNLYLPGQIKMVGNEAEYVDYKEQKQHRVRKNLLPNADWVEGYITVAGDIAQPSPSNQEITSPFVKVIHGKTYVFSYYPNEGEPWKAVIYYTEDKRFIKRQSTAYSASSVAFTVESGVGYVRFSYRSYGDGTFSQLELGDTATDYEPYIENTDLDVTLPALPTLSGTNTLSIGTEVQPSKVYIKGEKEREYT